jgi:hypothetical protein
MIGDWVPVHLPAFDELGCFACGSQAIGNPTVMKMVEASFFFSANARQG